MRWLLIVVGVMALATTLGARFLRTGSGKKSPTAILHTVARTTFEHDVVERGEVESAKNVEVRCQVKARNSAGTTLLEVVEEGTYVQPGDIVAKLDSTALEQELVQQQIVCNTKKAAMINAENLFEAAKIAKQEYVEGTFHQEQQTILSEILIAEENLRKAREYVDYSERLAARGYVTAQQLEGDAFAVEKARTELDTAKTKLRVLQEYTGPKMTKELDSAIKSAEALWESEKKSFTLEESKLKDIDEQIALCTIKAPQAGQVLYANDRSWRGGGSDFVVEPGALVRENQVLLQLPDANDMQVMSKINEARVTLVQPGMKATVRLDALGDATFDGEVTRVNEYPEPGSWFSSQIKEYATYIRILNGSRKIRPGLTAEVTIHVERVEDALTVPVQSIVERNRKYYCIAKNGAEWERKPVEVAATNEKFVMLKEGLEPGDKVALNPRELIEKLKLDPVGASETEATVSVKAFDSSKFSAQDGEEKPARKREPRPTGGS